MNNTLNVILFSLVFISLVGLVHFYLWLRLVSDAQLSYPWRQIGTGGMVLLAVSIPLTMFFSRGFSFDVTRYLTPFPFTWLGVMMLLVFFFLAVDGMRLVVFLLSKIPGNAALEIDGERRRVLARIVAGSAAAAVGGLSAVAIVKGLGKPVVKTLPVALSRFPKALDGFTIVQISDLHIGINYGKQWLSEVVRQVNGLSPDLVAITGDLIDGYVHLLEDEIAPLADLRAEHGVYFVTGNHEYYFAVDEWLAAIEKQGVRVLRNQAVDIGVGADSFCVAGIDDFNAGTMAKGHGPDSTRALRGVDPAREVVLLAHQPRAAIEAAQKNVGLVLSGHTHGGQIWPFTYLVSLQQPYNKGLYAVGAGTQIYVNQGTGLWGPPMRLGTECEITRIQLRRG